jgi:phosphoglucomutase
MPTFRKGVCFMDWKATYEKWLCSSNVDESMRKITMQFSEKEKEDAFYKNLEFGTGGMRGEIGSGTNCINKFMVRKATEGLAQYIEKQGEEAKKRGVAIAYDSRHMSPEFALEASLTFGLHGIRVLLI